MQFRSIAANFETTCAVYKNESVACWGSNVCDLLGPFKNNAAPVLVQQIEGKLVLFLLLLFFYRMGCPLNILIKGNGIKKSTLPF
jgi:hypothetical protein